ncbi:MAG: isocitrate lyase/PEP mutase family protein [Betaproteobacteria bacterium]|nr:isocitrate lyase/PEP mutase family protein [Betaproteobacteria bacterium]MBI3938738.1 isocitrate lyase/PEP mutase family protein [Betaproteobacteria bacterium]
MSLTRIQRMRTLLKAGKIIVSPGVYDGYSARLVEKMGFKAASTTGAGITNSRLGQPDIGIMSLLENVEACRHLAHSVSIPLMADADTGYGNAVTVYHAVQYFEAAGVVGINLEDQVSPKRCGHMQGKEMIDAREMAKKIEAAVKAKKDPDFIINARTDAVAVEGLEAAIARAKLYVAAGADMVFPDAVRSEDQIQRFVDGVKAPVSINMGFGIRSRPTTPLIPIKRLEQLGVARVSIARMLPAAALGGMKKALELMLDSIASGNVHDRPDLLAGIEEITDLMGYERIAELESRFLLEEQIERKYGAAKPQYVIRK